MPAAPGVTLPATRDTSAWPPQQERPRYPASVRRLAAAVFILFAGWLLYPALFATHVEAFSARLQTMAIMALHGHFAQDDLAYPVDLEYFYATRGGTIHALEGLMKLTHTTGDLNFRILIWISFALFVASCVAFVRRWSTCPAWTALAVLVLTPGLVEISFYYADNLPSAAMVTLGLAIVGRRTPFALWFAAGAALACGTLLRTDAIVAFPFLALLALLEDDRRLPRLFGAWLATAAGAAAVFLLSAKLTGISIRQSLLVARLHSAIHNSWGDNMSFARVMVLFFGPTVLLIALGIVVTWRTRSLRWNVAMIAWPLLFYILFMSRAIELRDYLLLGAPFVLLHGATGLTRLLRTLEMGTRSQHRLAVGAIALYTLTLVAPPLLTLHDGPRFALGRIYAPPLWRHWQRTTDGAIQDLHTLGATTQPGERLLILSTLYQSDRYLHLTLLEDGFTLLPLRSNPACGNVETFVKDGRTIFHVRTENPYFLLSGPPLAMPAEYVRAYQVNAGLTCLTPADYDRALMITWGRMWQGYLAESPEFRRPAGPLEIPFPNPRTPNIGKHKLLQVQRILPLSRQDVANIDARAQAAKTSFEAGNRGDWHAPHNYQEFHAQAQPLIWKSIPGLDPAAKP